jgi:hypothetical protein
LKKNDAKKKFDLEIQENLMNDFPTRILSELLKYCDTICKIPTRLYISGQNFSDTATKKSYGIPE